MTRREPATVDACLGDISNALHDVALRSPLIDLNSSKPHRLLPISATASAIADLLVHQTGRLHLDPASLEPPASAQDLDARLRALLAANQALIDRSGIPGLRLALGIVHWRDEKRDRTRRAPLWTLPVEIVPTDTERPTEPPHYALRAIGPLEPNVALNAKLDRPPFSSLATLADLPVEAGAPPPILGIEDRAILGIFDVGPLALARRFSQFRSGPRALDSLIERLARALTDRPHPDRPRTATLDTWTDWTTRTASPPGPNRHPLPADARQDQAIDHARHGRSFIIHGPPGTGKSQTIANILANAIEDGLTALLVTENTTAIDAVGRRLATTDHAPRVLTVVAPLPDVHAMPANGEPSSWPALLRRLDRSEKPAILTTSIVFALHVPDAWTFDLVIFDEASQIPAANAAAAIARAAQLIVCGDPQQMTPPQRATSSAHAALQTGLLQAAISADMPAITLTRHYRSRHPQLIAHSNRLFYRNQLLCPPSPHTRANIGVRLHHVDNAVFDTTSGVNHTEAVAVADEVLRNAQHNTDFTLGVIAMTSAQSMLLNEMIEQRLRAAKLAPERIGGKADEPLFVRAIDEVQGLERDIIIASLTVGFDARRDLLPNFGHITRPGGERRLNVLATRSRFRTDLFTSFRAEDIARYGGLHPALDFLHLYLDHAARAPQLLEQPTTDPDPLTATLRHLGYRLGRHKHAVLVYDKMRPLAAILADDGRSPLDVAADQAHLSALGWRVIRHQPASRQTDLRPPSAAGHLPGDLRGIVSRLAKLRAIP